MLLVTLLCWVLITQTSLGSRLSSETLDRLATDVIQTLEERIGALGQELVAERQDQETGEFAASASSVRCPFAGRHIRSKRSLREEGHSARVAAIYEDSTRRLLESFGTTEASNEAFLDHINRRLRRRQVNRSCGVFCPARVPTFCDKTKPYREQDGSCNNLVHPQWGQAYTCERRLLPAAYRDGVSEPRVAQSGRPLPSARLVSYRLHPAVNVPDRKLTHLAMAFGQFIDHDVNFVPTNPMPRLETSLGRRPGFLESTDPFNIEVPPGDPFYEQFNSRSLALNRSLACCRCRMGPRDQMNSRTSFIDASQIYGVSKDITDSLRMFSGGLLRSQVVRGSVFPPGSMEPNNDTCSMPREGKICFRSGDLRMNQNAGLVTLHTIFLRDHNRIARKLAAINPLWEDERLFHVTKRIVEARFQHVVFNEWLPAIVGPQVMTDYDLWPRKSGYTGYKPRVDPTMTNEFAVAAFRFGHSNIDGRFNLVGPRGNQWGALELKDTYFQPFEFYTRGVHDSAVRGFIQQPMQATDRFGDPAATNFLFRVPGRPFGNDLFAVDIQRGRDHGIRPYVDYVRHCGNFNVTSFADLYRHNLMPKRIAVLYSQIYEDVRDIDLFSAGLSEFPAPGAAMGHTFLCMVADMFHRLKWGDRFYYEHGAQAGSFKPGQLHTIRKTTLAKIICENTRISSRVQRNVFRSRQPKVDCEDLPDIQLKFWAD
ncbi:salivary peroxidase/catechol oxidase-like [Amblyomma americanum]